MLYSFFQSYTQLNPFKKRFIFGFLLLAITAFLLIPLPPAKDPTPYVDKIQHIVIFVVLGLVGLMAYAKSMRKLLISLLAYAACSEVLQHLLTSTRSGDWRDWLADCIGLAIAYWVYQSLLARQHKETPA